MLHLVLCLFKREAVISFIEKKLLYIMNPFFFFEQSKTIFLRGPKQFGMVQNRFKLICKRTKHGLDAFLLWSKQFTSIDFSCRLSISLVDVVTKVRYFLMIQTYDLRTLDKIEHDLETGLNFDPMGFSRAQKLKMKHQKISYFRHYVHVQNRRRTWTSLKTGWNNDFNEKT